MKATKETDLRIGLLLFASVCIITLLATPGCGTVRGIAHDLDSAAQVTQQALAK